MFSSSNIGSSRRSSSPRGCERRSRTPRQRSPRRAGRPFIVMEHLRGRSLAAELSTRKTLPVREALKYAGELLSALSAVHATGIVHRDIKPSNLFLCDLPNGRRVLKVIDFGAAGEHVDQRADVYAAAL